MARDGGRIIYIFDLRPPTPIAVERTSCPSLSSHFSPLLTQYTLTYPINRFCYSFLPGNKLQVTNFYLPPFSSGLPLYRTTRSASATLPTDRHAASSFPHKVVHSSSIFLSSFRMLNIFRCSSENTRWHSPNLLLDSARQQRYPVHSDPGPNSNGSDRRSEMCRSQPFVHAIRRTQRIFIG